MNKRLICKRLGSIFFKHILNKKETSQKSPNFLPSGQLIKYPSDLNY